ncbi:site-specific integrase [Nitrosopumilus sp. b3]|uniref:site-specific integrase n=1 Tax=Nitrosopumilus sp. b3 TaxID=2109909 RepID=UPI0015F42BCF|nr:site-specific integrase [Nitrosopumilus sp. b3]KAF6247097.1 site-specific integrase [Nitrosopumilus sp. b3]
MIKDQILDSRNIPQDEVAERQTDMGKQKLVTTNNTAKQQKISRKQRMLANPDVKRWYDNLARGSPLTADVRVRRLDKFCEIHEITPMELAELGMKDLRTVTNLLEDHITWMEEKDYAPGYIEDFVKSVKSWLREFDVDIRRKLKIRNQDYTPTLQNERVPNAEEMSEILSRATLRASVMISLMAKSGVRPEVIGNHDGTDGLRIKDLPDIVIHQGVAKCINAPNRIIVRRELSKARHQYFTFSTSSGTKKLLAYLNDRLASGEPLHGDSPVVAPDYVYKTNRGNNKNKPFLPTRQVSSVIRETFRPRFKWRPYVLRAYFDTELLIAESKGKIAHDFRAFFMGHKGTIEAKYTTNKGILPEILIKEMRESFKRSEEFLDLEITKEDPILQQKEEAQDAIQNATPEELGKVLEMLQTLNIGKTSQAKE